MGNRYVLSFQQNKQERYEHPVLLTSAHRNTFHVVPHKDKGKVRPRTGQEGPERE